MHDYRIFETERFRKDLRAMVRAGHERIADRLRRSVYPRLREHPHFGPHIRKLKGPCAGDVALPNRVVAVFLRDR